MRYFPVTLSLIFTLLFSGCDFNNHEALLNDLKSQNMMVVNEAAYELGESEEEKAVPLLMNLIKGDQPKEIKITAIEALGKIGANIPVDALVDVLGERNNDEIRIAACNALGKIKSPGAVEPLLGVAGVEDRDVRLFAIWALGSIGDEKAIPLLTKLVSDPDKYLSYNARQALKTIGNGK